MVAIRKDNRKPLSTHFSVDGLKNGEIPCRAPEELIVSVPGQRTGYCMNFAFIKLPPGAPLVGSSGGLAGFLSRIVKPDLIHAWIEGLHSWVAR